ncbi:hypothetical protein EYF80_035976 [Liparis tanakae]|uniref:Uncharacterized protein n=1 Tax=Liparis tanakae TaxID=230148 RepID=A0A4Z2GKU0_9TELE|nr:hypothetical protein EYF80_035976 [Liparis tanakae]
MSSKRDAETGERVVRRDAAPHCEGGGSESHCNTALLWVCGSASLSGEQMKPDAQHVYPAASVLIRRTNVPHRKLSTLMQHSDLCKRKRDICVNCSRSFSSPLSQRGCGPRQRLHAGHGDLEGQFNLRRICRETATPPYTAGAGPRAARVERRAGNRGDR